MDPSQLHVTEGSTVADISKDSFSCFAVGTLDCLCYQCRMNWANLALCEGAEVLKRHCLWLPANCCRHSCCVIWDKRKSEWLYMCVIGRDTNIYLEVSGHNIWQKNLKLPNRAWFWCLVTVVSAVQNMHLVDELSCINIWNTCVNYCWVVHICTVYWARQAPC